MNKKFKLTKEKPPTLEELSDRIDKLGNMLAAINESVTNTKQLIGYLQGTGLGSSEDSNERS